MIAKDSEFQMTALENARKLRQSRRRRRRLQKLKAERVQEELRTMPGWDLSVNGKAVESVREFCHPAGAAKFAGFVAELAVAEGQPVHLGVSGNWVFLTLPPRPGTGGLNLPVFDFARQIG